MWYKYLYPVRSYWHFSEIQDGSRDHLGFQVMWIWPFWRVDSVVFELCTKYGSNICYSYRDRRIYASDFHLMTSRELTSVSTFGHVVISARLWCVFHKICCGKILSSPELLTFFWNSKWQQPSWIFRLCEFGHSGMLMAWYLCFVPNMVQISVIVTEHLSFRPSFDDVTRINFRFRLLSRGHLCMAVMHLPMKSGADIFIQSGVIDIFRKLKMVAAAILDLFGWAVGPTT